MYLSIYLRAVMYGTGTYVRVCLKKGGGLHEDECHMTLDMPEKYFYVFPYGTFHSQGQIPEHLRSEDYLRYVTYLAYVF